MATSHSTAEHTHVARQPILDARGQVYGYELRCREDGATGDAGSIAARMISDVVTGPGFDVLSDGKRAFLSLSAEVLLSDAINVLDPERFVLGIPDAVPATPTVLEVCARLNQRGYLLALEGFSEESQADALLPFARFATLEVQDTPSPLVTALAGRLLERGVTVIAEHVESEDALASAKAAGCSLFQGYYFCRPQTVAVQAMSANQLTQMQLFAALMKPNVSLGAIEELLKRDTTLSYRVLRCVNSAGFGLKREIGSIREALLLLGLEQIRKWASLWTLAALNRGPGELLTMTIVRARACETVGNALGREDQGYFLLGLCSLLDTLLGRPMEQVVSELPVNAEIRAALLGTPNDARHVLDAITEYERAEWMKAFDAAAAAGLDEDTLPEAYLGALTWARAISQAA